MPGIPSIKIPLGAGRPYLRAAAEKEFLRFLKNVLRSTRPPMSDMFTSGSWNSSMPERRTMPFFSRMMCVALMSSS